MESLRASSLVSLLALLAIGCGGDDEAESADSALPANAADAVSTYAEIVHASYEDSLITGRTLDGAATAFIAAPSAAAHAAVQDAWRASREPYLQTEVYRFYAGPIDEEGGPEGLLNAWPLDEGHIDYVAGEPNAGIVNDPQRPISASSLLAANLNPGETDVATGYHAIEFLLWGQDLNPDGPGLRPFTDYALDAAAPGVSNQDRRGEYLTTTSAILLDNLADLVDAWAPNVASNYRATFEAATPAEALTRIMSGMIILSGFELSQERLSAALDAQDQEEEHSCFSDNTHRDMVQDVRGIQNVWLGSYDPIQGGAISGTGIRDVIAEGDSGLANDITAQIAESLSLAEGLQVPFDREISPTNAAGNARVDALIESLIDQEELLEAAFELYGLNRIPDPT